MDQILNNWLASIKGTSRHPITHKQVAMVLGFLDRMGLDGIVVGTMHRIDGDGISQLQLLLGLPDTGLISPEYIPLICKEVGILGISIENLKTDSFLIRDTQREGYQPLLDGDPIPPGTAADTVHRTAF